MKNRLKDVFSYEEPSGYLLTMTFSNQTAAKDFYEKLDLMYETGERQEITGVQSILTEQKIIGKSFPYSNHNEIKHLVIYPTADTMPFQVQTEYGDYCWQFERIQTNTGATIRNTDTNIVRIVMKLDQGSHKVTMNYIIRPKEASSMYEIARVCSATVALLTQLFRSDSTQIDEQIRTTIEQFANTASYFKIITELENKLNKHFDPENITDDDTEKNTVYELYYMLVKGVALRKNYLMTGFSVDYSNDEGLATLSEDTLFTMSFQSSTNYNIFGESFSVYLFSVAFNLTLESITDDKENQMYVIKMKDSDSMPGYISFKGFLDDSQRMKEEKRMRQSFSEGVDEYKDANSWSEWVQQDFFQ